MAPKIFLNLCMSVLPSCMSITCVAMSSEARRVQHIPWKWSYGLLAAM